ncbi:MAG: preprotein translocase subunit SecA [Dehalococcoidales bacterium]|nr:preprotein translocase subunit SecA [Dehalococcoidales bacterium]
MFKWLGGLIDSNEKELKRVQPVVDEINELEPEFKKLSDAELRSKTAEFKASLIEATAEIKEELVEAQKELAETKQCLPDILDEFEKKGKESQCKQLEERVVQLKKELLEVEEDVLYELLPEAFAAVREAARRTIGQRHFDVQLMGGIVLHQGKIAEMKTGEGKTLVATLPLYLNSLTGKGCHLVTVNDYLSKRDHHWMAPIYHALGVSVASIQHEAAFIYDPGYEAADPTWSFLRPVLRRQAYEADITYGTNNEFGFDYLRDNMVVELAQCVQRSPNYSIVDEVDNILIDEARTPLIISGPAEETGPVYEAVNDAVNRMNMKTLAYEPFTPEEKEDAIALEEQYDYIAYEKEHHVKATARGQEKIAKAFHIKVEDLFGGESIEEFKPLTPEEAQMREKIRSIFRQSMTAHALYHIDQQYVVKDKEVIIVDEFTGRLMPGRRYSEGLHQAIEAKERVKVQRESMTFATITFQNYFRMYHKLAGMTGTALTEAEEFHKIYKLEVLVIPTNKPMLRQDFPDRIYKDEKAKFQAVVREVAELHQQKQPMLIGTVSIEKSEVLSDLLKRKGIPHHVLNAKYHEKEAYIIAQAGRLEAVTVATNMAGRGVDIVLGGNPTERNQAEWQKEHDRVVELGGLHIVGTERHEARRIDNQLRGRTGRQGDPGSTRFFVSLEDDIVKRFGGDRIKGIMDWVGMDEDTPIENKLVNRSIEGAQVRVEGYHFDVRKHLVDYDDVVNKQRELIYEERRKILSGADLKANTLTMVEAEIAGIVTARGGDDYGNNQDIEGLVAEVSTILPLPPEFADTAASLKPGQITDKLMEQAQALYEQREQEVGADNMRVLERMIMLSTIDNLWVEHLTTMEDMRQQAGWQTLRQVKAVDAYKNEGFKQFQVLLETIRHDVAHAIYHVGIVRQEVRQPAPSRMAQVAASSAGATKKQRVKVAGNKVGRNDPCPCGSGKKYKNCCGR